jgi:NADH:ubiquinone oxidoreductase subunit 6 (subunit J)
MIFLFSNIHTIFLLGGFLLIIAAITILTNFAYGMLALGIVLIIIAMLISKGGENK